VPRGPGLLTGTAFPDRAARYGMHSRPIRPACLDLHVCSISVPEISVPENPAPVSYGLARWRALERSTNFSGRLVAVLVQFLESLLQRPELHGAFRRPFPINIESVGRRWTGRRSLQGRQQSLHRCVVTVGGGHFCTPYKLESVRNGSGGIAVWSRAGVVSLHHTVCCLDAGPGSIWWQKIDAGPECAGFLVVLRTFISTIKMQSIANLRRCFPLLFSDFSICSYRIQRLACRRAARFAVWARSGSESCPESDCARSSTFTSATPATGSRRSSRSGRKKQRAAAQGRRAGRGASRERPHLKARFPTTAWVSSRPRRM